MSDQPTLLEIPDECGATHPARHVTCSRPAFHSGQHAALDPIRGWRSWSTIWHADVDMHARAGDPESSHEAAKRDFGAPGHLAGAILEHLEDEWATCRQLAELVFGMGPYTYEQAVGINKIHTAALELHRKGLLERDEPAAGPIRYRRANDAS